MENKVLELIIEFVNAINNGDKISYTDSDKREYQITNCRYLLGQIIRSYYLPPTNYHISVAAMALWNRITSADIHKHFYAETIVCDRADDVEVNIYKGNAKSGEKTKIMMNSRLRYNDVFHNEHMVSVKTITTQLLTEKDISCEKVSEILNKIHICRILKDEDKKIKHKSTRPDDYKIVIKNDYREAGIEILKE